jgi:alpha-beta hydrolase superfamily lysophospholipase
VTPPSWLTRKIFPTDNVPEMIAMARDPLMLWGARADALYGLVATMQHAWRETGELRVPTLFLYGAHDEIIPKRPAFEAAARLPAGARTAYYAKGWHLLLRDLQAANVWADTASFVENPAAPLPSGAPPIPPPRSARHDERRGAGVVTSPLGA